MGWLVEDRGYRTKCWIWQGSLHPKGYGRCCRMVRGRKHDKAHRWSYEEHVGDIPEGMTLDHLCLVKECVRPDHLEPVTAGENMTRAFRSGLFRARDRRRRGLA